MQPPQTEKLLTKLFDDGVAFVLVGAVAGLAHGLARATYDVDVCYWRHPDNIDRVCRSLAALAPHLREPHTHIPFHLDVATLEALRDLPLDTAWGALDLLAEVAGLGDYESVLGFTETLDLFDRPLRVLSLDGLILAKRAAGRPQDLLDLASLQALRELRQRPDP
jgi:NAD(P)-dependent dehydrogenase (short-subunit alcohol dehydrogenase family)